MCEGIESHCVECVYFPCPKQVLKDILGQLRMLWALPGDELLYLDSQETANLFLGSVLFAAGLGRDAVHTKERSGGHSQL